MSFTYNDYNGLVGKLVVVNQDYYAEQNGTWSDKKAYSHLILIEDIHQSSKGSMYEYRCRVLKTNINLDDNFIYDESMAHHPFFLDAHTSINNAVCNLYCANVYRGVYWSEQHTGNNSDNFTYVSFSAWLQSNQNKLKKLDNMIAPIVKYAQEIAA